MWPAGGGARILGPCPPPLASHRSDPTRSPRAEQTRRGKRKRCATALPLNCHCSARRVRPRQTIGTRLGAQKRPTVAPLPGQRCALLTWRERDCAHADGPADCKEPDTHGNSITPADSGPRLVRTVDHALRPRARLRRDRHGNAQPADAGVGSCRQADHLPARRVVRRLVRRHRAGTPHDRCRRSRARCICGYRPSTRFTSAIPRRRWLCAPSCWLAR